PIKKEDVIYRIIVQPGSFIRYSIVKDGDTQYIYILNGVAFTSKMVEYTYSGLRKYQNIEYSKTVPLSNPADFEFKITKAPKDLLPEQQYLASEYITGVPMIIPYKFRFNVPSTQDIASINPSISYTFGVRFKLGNNPYKNNYFRFIPFGIGLGTDTYLNRDSVFKSGYKGETALSLSYCAGGTFEFNDKFNLGVFIGADRMFGNKQNFFYQGKPWLGIGFGIKFGSTDK
ncbi:MAG: hypothetical protein JWR09_4873, partial [Mucilaginibacter sp.]|nr:hypothetical protein [Mucilaginibacter sp.]